MPLLSSSGGLIRSKKLITASTDPSFSNVALLLHFDGSNNSTAFTEVKGKTITANGNARISTNQARFSQSGLFDGDADFLSTVNTSELNLSSADDFTIEAWIYKTITGFIYAICGNLNGEIANSGYVFLISNEDKLRFQSNGATLDVISSSLIVSNNQWNYVAVSKAGNNYTFSLNGVTETIVNSTIWNSSGNTIFSIGYSSRSNFPYYFNGYIDEFRFTNGVARNISSTPTAPFPNS